MNFKENHMPLKSMHVNIQNIYRVYKELIIIFLPLIISRFLESKIFSIIKMYFIKVDVSYDKNLATIWIIYLVLISFFITNINTLIGSFIYFFLLFSRFIYLNPTCKNLKVTKVQFFTLEIFVYGGDALVNRALVL